MRTLICGIVGALTSAVAWMAIEHTTHLEFGWLAVAVGIVTGFAVHKSAGAGSGGSYARGALAAFLALIACVGCRQVYAKVIVKSIASAAVIAAVESTDEANAAATEASESEQESKTDVPNVPLEERVISPVGRTGDRSIGSGFSQWDMLWLSMSALAAYLVGKGRDEDVAVDDGEENAESTDAANAEPT